MRKLYAVGFSGWVEIREAETPPKAHTSKFEKPILVQVPDEYGKMKAKKQVLKIALTTYDGGRVLRTLKVERFAALTGKYVEKNQMIALNLQDAKRLEGELSR